MNKRDFIKCLIVTSALGSSSTLASKMLGSFSEGFSGYSSAGIPEFCGTPLDRSHNASLLNMLMKEVQDVYYVCYDENYLELFNQITLERFTAAITDVVSLYKEKRAIYDYKVICDVTNNSPSDVDEGIPNVLVCVKSWFKSDIIIAAIGNPSFIHVYSKLNLF